MDIAEQDGPEAVYSFLANRSCEPVQYVTEFLFSLIKRNTKAKPYLTTAFKSTRSRYGDSFCLANRKGAGLGLTIVVIHSAQCLGCSHIEDLGYLYPIGGLNVSSFLPYENINT